MISNWCVHVRRLEKPRTSAIDDVPGLRLTGSRLCGGSFGRHHQCKNLDNQYRALMYSEGITAEHMSWDVYERPRTLG